MTHRPEFDMTRFHPNSCKKLPSRLASLPSYRKVGRALCAVAFLVSLLAGGGVRQARGQATLSPSLQELFAEGTSALKAKKLDEAEERFKQIIHQGGKSGVAHHNLGLVYFERRDYSKAIAQFREAIRMDPKLAGAQILLGMSLLSTANVKEATLALERGVKLDPSNTTARMQLAQAYLATDHLPAAVSQYRALRKLTPRDPEIAYRLGKTYLKLAEWSLKKIVEIDPNSARVSEALGDSFRMQGRWDQAIRAFEQAAERDPRLPEIHLKLAQAYLVQGNREAAEREVGKELMIMPESAAALALRHKLGGGTR